MYFDWNVPYEQWYEYKLYYFYGILGLVKLYLVQEGTSVIGWFS